MRAPQIQSAERLSALIFADRISADERGLAFPTFGFWGSSLAGGAWHYGRLMCCVPEKPTANKAGAGNGAGAVSFHVERLRRAVPDLVSREIERLLVLGAFCILSS